MYKLEFSRVAAKDLKKYYVPTEMFTRALSSLDDISVNPRLGKALMGILKGSYSYRVGVYRIIYTISHDRLVVNVIDIGHRREVYR